MLYQCNYFFVHKISGSNGTTVAIMKFLEVIMIAAAVVMFTLGRIYHVFRGNKAKNRSVIKEKCESYTGIVALIIAGFIEAIQGYLFRRTTQNYGYHEYADVDEISSSYGWP